MSENKVCQVICEKIREIKLNDCDKITGESLLNYQGLGLNSLEMMTLLVYLEDFFDIEFDGEKMLLENYEKVSHLIKVIEYLIDEREVIDDDTSHS